MFFCPVVITLFALSLKFDILADYSDLICFYVFVFICILYQELLFNEACLMKPAAALGDFQFLGIFFLSV